MPLQQLVSAPPLRKIAQLAETGHPGARQLTTYFVGQAVGLMNQERPVRRVVYEFMEDFVNAAERPNAFIDDQT